MNGEVYFRQINQKRAYITILTSDKIDVKAKDIRDWGRSHVEKWNSMLRRNKNYHLHHNLKLIKQK